MVDRAFVPALVDTNGIAVIPVFLLICNTSLPCLIFFLLEGSKLHVQPLNDLR
jgi:hypothetical protein